ncbi:hypothetical protein OH77DRAFT_73867 [Trametes cingulata]|nr:hypothetical protein OH77DRAFT_73867 [Trametes cingulata]
MLALADPEPCLTSRAILAFLASPSRVDIQRNHLRSVGGTGCRLGSGRNEVRSLAHRARARRQGEIDSCRSGLARGTAAHWGLGHLPSSHYLWSYCLRQSRCCARPTGSPRLPQADLASARGVRCAHSIAIAIIDIVERAQELGRLVPRRAPTARTYAPSTPVYACFGPGDSVTRELLTLAGRHGS